MQTQENEEGMTRERVFMTGDGLRRIMPEAKKT